MESYNQLPPPPLLPDLVSSTTSNPSSFLPHHLQQQQHQWTKPMIDSIGSDGSITPLEQTTLTALDQTTLTALDQSPIGECYPVEQQDIHQQQPPSQQHCCQNFSLPPPPPQYCVAPASAVPSQQTDQQQSQLPDLIDVIMIELEKFMIDEDTVVRANSTIYLYSLTSDSIKGQLVCQAISESRKIMSSLYSALTDDRFKNDSCMLCCATGNLRNISKYEEGRVALLDRYLYPSGNEYSKGVESLIRSLSSREFVVVSLAIQAMHKLLLDGRAEVEEAAKAQIKYGLKSIVQLLENQCPMEDYRFKVIVMDCLEILAHDNPENVLIIKECGGYELILKTIENYRENFDNPNEILIERATQVLRCLMSIGE